MTLAGSRSRSISFANSFHRSSIFNVVAFAALAICLSLNSSGQIIARTESMLLRQSAPNIILRGPVRDIYIRGTWEEASRGELLYQDPKGGAVLEDRSYLGVEPFSVGRRGQHCSGLTVCFAELKPWRLFAAANAVGQPKPEPGAARQFLVVAPICSQNVVWA